MSSDVRLSKTLRPGLAAVAALALLLAPVLFGVSCAIAQSDDPAAVQAQDNSGQNDPNSAESQAAAAQTAVNEAEAKLEEATQKRDQLEGEDAPQDQIDEANQAITDARSQKQFAEQALNRLNESQAAGNGGQNQ